MAVATGGRLREALEARNRSLKWLEAKLASRDIGSSSYRSLHRYIQGSQIAPFNILVAAAEELEINVKWLVQGKGVMVDEGWEADFEWLDELSRAADEYRRRFEYAVAENFPYFPNLPEHIRDQIFAQFEGELRLDSKRRPHILSEPYVVNSWSPQTLARARNLGRYLNAGLDYRQFDLDDPEIILHRVKNYSRLACFALTMLMPEERLDDE